MGQQQSTPRVEPPSVGSTTAAASDPPSSACPVRHHSSKSSSSINSIKTDTSSSSKRDSSDTAGGCPVRNKRTSDAQNSNTSGASGYKYPTVYNVYNTPIDLTNQMPSQALQKPSEGQQQTLSTDRVKSTIPKGGTTDDSWLYPSSQMFWNALVRKHKTEGVAEQDVDTVVAIHNNMNENTWRQLLAWEQLHMPANNAAADSATAADQAERWEPKLLRFEGRPDERSPKAWLKVLCGHPAPFDRHDWYVDRGSGQGVHRYVIDYYHDESAVQQDSTPVHLSDAQSLKSIQVDVRPALDSLSAVADRLLLMPMQQLQQQLRGDNNSSAYKPLPFFAPSRMVVAERRHTAQLQQQVLDMKANCAQQQQRFADCVARGIASSNGSSGSSSSSSGEEEAVAACGSLLIPFQLCAGRVVCPELVKEFDQCTGKSPAAKTTSAITATATTMTASLQQQQTWQSWWNNKPQHQQQQQRTAVDVEKAAATLEKVRQQLEIFELDCKKHLSSSISSSSKK